MQGTRGRDTKPELALRRALHALALRYFVGRLPHTFSASYRGPCPPACSGGCLPRRLLQVWMWAAPHRCQDVALGAALSALLASRLAGCLRQVVLPATPAGADPGSRLACPRP
ncbi:very short patch repair endonuclease [Micromonospora aurantiaca]